MRVDPGSTPGRSTAGRSRIEPGSLPYRMLTEPAPGRFGSILVDSWINHQLRLDPGSTPHPGSTPGRPRVDSDPARSRIAAVRSRVHPGSIPCGCRIASRPVDPWSIQDRSVAHTGSIGCRPSPARALSILDRCPTADRNRGRSLVDPDRSRVDPDRLDPRATRIDPDRSKVDRRLRVDPGSIPSRSRTNPDRPGMMAGSTAGCGSIAVPDRPRIDADRSRLYPGSSCHRGSGGWKGMGQIMKGSTLPKRTGTERQAT